MDAHLQWENNAWLAPPSPLGTSGTNSSDEDDHQASANTAFPSQLASLLALASPSYPLLLTRAIAAVHHTSTSSSILKNGDSAISLPQDTGYWSIAKGFYNHFSSECFQQTWLIGLGPSLSLTGTLKWRIRSAMEFLGRTRVPFAVWTNLERTAGSQPFKKTWVIKPWNNWFNEPRAW